MLHKNKIPKKMLPIIEKMLAGKSDNIDFPPPVFDAMQGELIDFNTEQSLLSNKFPILAEQLNPYGNMQGGIICAAIDNTIGPLSLLVAQPNFTRYITVKYSKTIAFELGYIYVTARFIEKKKRQLFFEAIVKNADGEKLASAKSTNWIID
ncbi:MAG: PaaI family thioesterase [Pseudomonadota bacterium]